MLRHELVNEERWLSSERFNRLLAVYQVLPGPEAHELAVHIGLLRGGRLGALLAGLGFMLPGFLLILVLASLYKGIDLTQPAVAATLLGAQIAVVALVTRAVPRIGRHILVNPAAWLIAIGVALATTAGASFLLTLPAAAIAYVLAARFERGALPVLAALAIAGAVVAITTGAPGLTGSTTSSEQVAGDAGSPTTFGLFGSGLKAGLLTFGGAYTAIPFVRHDAVGSGWLTDAQFLDGLALGGILPAPLIIFATFVGYLAGGLPGAVAITLGIFLPAFAFAMVFGERLEAVVEWRPLHRALEGVAAGVVGIITVTAIQLGVAVANRVPSIPLAVFLFALCLVLLFAWRSRWATPAVVMGGATAGWLLLGGLG